MKQERPKHGSFVLIALVYAGIAVCTTWPLIARMTTHLPDGTDTLSHYWNGWWAWQALREGRSSTYTPYLFYPGGASTVYHNFAWLHILAWIALRPLIGGIAAYNLAFLVNLALCGLAAFLLVYELTGDRRAGFVAGLIYQCWPYRMTQPSHPNLMSTWAIPIALLFLLRVIRRGRWQDGLLAGLSLAVVGYTRWQLLVPAAISCGVYLLAALPRNQGRRQIVALVLAGCVAGLALAPPALLLVREWRAQPTALVKGSEESLMQTDVLAYATPPSAHSVLGSWTELAYRRYYAGRGSRFKFSPYIGLVALCLALIGICKTRLGDSLAWVGLALLFVLLALGPVLRVNGQTYPAVPMFYNLAARFVVIRVLRVPERFNMFLALPIAVLSGYGLVHLMSGARAAYTSLSLQRFPFGKRGQHKKWIPVLLFCLVSGAIYLEYLVTPLLLQTGQVSTFYAQLAVAPERFAILNIPVDPYRSKPYMFAQTVHQHPILQGHLSRYPEGAFEYLDSQPWLRAMRRYSDFPPKHTDVSRQLTALAEDGIRYLVIQKDLVGAERWAKWERYLAVSPRFEDSEIAVYTTRPVARQDYALNPELAPGVGVISKIVSSPCTQPGQTLEVDVAWGTTAPPGKDLSVELGLVSQDGTVRQTTVYPIARDRPSHAWPANAVAWGYYLLRVPSDLLTGAYDVTLALADAETGIEQGETIVVERVDINPSPCTFSVPQDATQVNALFGEKMRLMGYRSQQGHGQQHITLLWRTERRMTVDYKVFVHIFDPVTGIPVAQDDAMPLHWKYPTTYWDPGEVVTDVIAISLEETQPGTYGIAVGVYDPTSMERLPVIDQAGQPQPDGRLVLPEQVVRIDGR